MGGGGGAVARVADPGSGFVPWTPARRRRRAQAPGAAWLRAQMKSKHKIDRPGTSLYLLYLSTTLAVSTSLACM